QLIDYRGLEGIGRMLAKYKLIPYFGDYTTLWNRIHKIKPKIIMPDYKDLELASDGTGLKTSNAGEYRLFKYGDPDRNKKKYLIVVITSDVKKKKLLNLEIHIQGCKWQSKFPQFRQLKIPHNYLILSSSLFTYPFRS
ncbi:MAG: hypothetical protein ACP5FQ_07510, partial [Thermoplasmata archaeon]